MENVEDIVNRCKNKKQTSKKYINKNSVLTKLLLSIMFLLSSLIFTKVSEENKNFYKETFLTNSLSFNKINNIYEKYFGEVMPSYKTEITVFDSEINYKSIEKYNDGEKLELDQNTLISNLSGGLVVFVGEKENLGNTVIIQGNDGYDIWYSNLANINVKLYDYIEKEVILGETVDEYLYLTIKKENEYIKYEDYKN